ncbi:MAG: GNAT family N-acetyltransferase [Sphingobium sp.]|nr:GNAT family N-acetyltransferase [Sphingobium sp.]
MAADSTDLLTPLRDHDLQLIPLEEAHRDNLRAACAEDPEIWRIYASNFGPPDFDRNFTTLLANPGRLAFAVMLDDRLVGMSAYLRIDLPGDTLEIGNTYIAPSTRGTGLNRRMKKLMIEHAFACHFRRIEFRVDARNERSQAAVLKLGAQREGLLRAERVIWTGYVRDTCLFGLLESDWTP